MDSGRHGEELEDQREREMWSRRRTKVEETLAPTFALE